MEQDVSLQRAQIPAVATAIVFGVPGSACLPCSSAYPLSGSCLHECHLPLQPEKMIGNLWDCGVQSCGRWICPTVNNWILHLAIFLLFNEERR